MKWSTDPPARLVPAIAYALGVNVTDLLPPLDGPPNAAVQCRTPLSLKVAATDSTNPRNLVGGTIRKLRRERKWTQYELAERFRNAGLPITRNIIANIETQRCVTP